MEEQIPGGVQSPATWPDYPSMLRCSPEHHPASDSVQRVGVPFDFSSQLFEGRAVVRVRGVSSSDDDAYFRDRNRKMQCLVQGRFKKRIRCRDVVCGQEYSKPLELPLQLVVQPVLSAVQYMQPSIQVDLYSKRPYLLTPLAATAQALSVERSGQESNRGFVASSRGAQADMAVVEDPVEDTALLGGWFSDSKRSSQQRKDWFNAKAVVAEPDNDKADEGEWFEPEVVYTFDFYSHVLDMQTMTAFGFDVVPILNGNPVVCMARLRACEATDNGNAEAEPEHLWKFEVWHERMLAKTS